MKEYKFLFLVGSQPLYGEDALHAVNEHARIMTDGFNSAAEIPCTVEVLDCLTTSQQILTAIDSANSDPMCAGVIAWMHTFSPSKQWIAGLGRLDKPYLHINTQFNRDIPWNTIDMDFMNLNQSAHGDREHGYITARMNLKRKVIAGYWQDGEFLSEIGAWMRAAVGMLESRRLRVLRLGDNMRNVAVTDGDKIEAQIKLGWQVDYFGLGDVIGEIDSISEAETAEKTAQYTEKYIMDTEDIQAVRYQAKVELGLERFLRAGGFGAFHTNFEELHGLRQLPGLACQNLMLSGYGFGAEGDWKVAALTRIIKLMSRGLDGGTSFMEDYTYHFEKGNEMILGAHMLEICPSIAADKPKIQVHPLGIGDREPPARAVFNAKGGKAIVVSLVDMGTRLRMIVNDIDCVSDRPEMPRLPVASALWKPQPSLRVSAASWILAGGSHHSVLTYALTAEHMRNFAEMAGIEFLHINDSTTVENFRKELETNEFVWGV
ncbi:MAG: L-arabinose isomerase [Clostridiales bacterium]|nr:L-arabinose isomerase [Clostridiales bacterium]